MSGARLWIAAAVLALAASPSPAQDPALPELELAGLEPAVAEQIATLETWARAAVADPERTEVERAEGAGELGRLLHAYDLREPAEACYRVARSHAPGDFRWTYLLAYLLHSAGRLEEAGRLYESALALESRVPPALVRLAQVERELGQPEAAERNLRQALRLDPTNAAALAELGELLVDVGRHAEGVEALEAALALHPDANRLYYPLAMARRAAGDLEGARALLEASGPVGIRPADPLVDGLADLTTGERVHLLRGRAAFAAERYAEAAEEFEKASELAPDSLSALVNLGAALGALGETARAIEVFTHAVELAPANVPALFNLGSLHRSRGDLERSLDYFRQAVLYGPDDGQSRYQLGEALRRVGRPAEALIQYERAIELRPPGELARLGRAQALAGLERYAEARRELEESLTLLPASGLLAQALARLLASCPEAALRDGARAVELAERVFAAQPTAFHAETLALALAESDRCEEAATWQQRYLEAVAQGDPGRAPAPAREALGRYQRGAPCRPPVSMSLDQ